jgi:hypothetical protein
MDPKLQPFLFRFATPVIAPARSPQPSDSYYDHALDVVRWTGAPTHPPVVTVEGIAAPQTKKNDLEKGEDSKDRSMWP